MLCGKPVEVRALTALEMDRLRKVCPKPVPELMPNPIPGAMPAMVTDENGPRYASAMEAWVSKMQTAIVAIAADISGPTGACYSEGMTNSDLLAYVTAIVPPMRARFTEPEIGSAYDTINSLSDPATSATGEDRIAAAKKNLSGLSREALTRTMLELGFSPTPTSSPQST